MRSTQLWRWTCAATLLACGGTPSAQPAREPEPPAVALPKPAPTTPASEAVKLFSSEKRVGGEAIFATPLVHVKVSGAPGVFAVDTGAEVPVIDRDFAARAGVRVIDADFDGRDAHGHPVPMQVAPAPVDGVDLGGSRRWQLMERQLAGLASHVHAVESERVRVGTETQGSEHTYWRNGTSGSTRSRRWHAVSVIRRPGSWGISRASCSTGGGQGA